MLLPYAMLKQRDLIRDCSLKLIYVDASTRCLEKLASSYKTQWTVVTPGSEAAAAIPDLSAKELESLCAYQNTAGKIKSTVIHRKRYLVGPERRLGNFIHATLVTESGTYLYALDATASFGSVPKTGKHDYSIFITAKDDEICTYCCCKNGRSGKCSHVAAALMVLMECKNNLRGERNFFFY